MAESRHIELGARRGGPALRAGELIMRKRRALFDSKSAEVPK
jgi:hypothetical protein